MDLLTWIAASGPRLKAEKSDQLGFALMGLCILLSIFMLGWRSHQPSAAPQQDAQDASRQGFVHIANRNHTAAKGYFAEALTYGSQWGSAHLGLGALAYIDGDWLEAQTHARQALSADPTQAEAYSLLYKAYRAQQDSAGGEQVLRTCLEHRPDYGPAHLALGKIHLGRQEFALALTHYERYLELNRALHEEALMHCVNTGKSELIDYLSALLAHPSPLVAGRLSKLIQPYLHQGDLIYASEVWHIDDETLGGQMALILERLGQDQRAAKFYQWAAVPIP